jgi:hypothetical protein
MFPQNLLLFPMAFTVLHIDLNMSELSFLATLAISGTNYELYKWLQILVLIDIWYNLSGGWY